MDIDTDTDVDVDVDVHRSVGKLTRQLTRSHTHTGLFYELSAQHDHHHTSPPAKPRLIEVRVSLREEGKKALGGKSK
jgi:hypothetical protein